MNKKTIISIIILLIAIIAVVLFIKKEPLVVTPIEETTPRNDTVVEEATTTEPVVKSYSLAEVNLHDKASDCWLVIEGKVINPTEFIAKGLHPNDKILNGCGKDATSMFASVDKHDGGKAKAALKQYEIGVLK